MNYVNSCVELHWRFQYLHSSAGSCTCCSSCARSPYTRFRTSQSFLLSELPPYSHRAIMADLDPLVQLLHAVCSYFMLCANQLSWLSESLVWRNSVVADGIAPSPMYPAIRNLHFPHLSREFSRAPIHIDSLRESFSTLFEAHNRCTLVRVGFVSHDQYTMSTQLKRPMRQPN